jgi:spermidine synthase
MTGFYSILGQVVILRELNVAFYGIELVYIISFAFWLIGTAVGVSYGRRQIIPKEKNILVLFILSACALIIDIVFLRGIRIIFGGVEGGYLPFTTQIAGLVLSLLPVSFFAGLMFHWIAKKYIGENETLAKAYSIESIGGIIGGLGSTLFLSYNISNLSAAIICSALTIFVAFYFSYREKRRLQTYISFSLVIILLLLFGFSRNIDLWLTSWNHPFIAETIDTPYNRVTITKPGNQICVFEDDALSYETEGVRAEEFVQLSTLQTNKLNNVLILGGGFRGMITELLKLPVNSISYVEINKKIITVLQNYLPDNLRKSLKNKKVNIIYNDPRKYLQSQDIYDIILVGMPEPMSVQNNRFYTREFFSQCANVLSEKGILSFQIRSSENLWTSQLTERNQAIYAALKSSFGNVLVLPGVTNTFIASKSNLITDTKFLINRFIERGLQTKLISPQYINYIFTNDRFFGIQKLLSGQVPDINTDLKPVCFRYTMTIWLSKFFPEIMDSGNLSLEISNLNKIIILIISVIISIILFITGRKYFRLGRIILVFGAGFIGMITETVLIILYQIENGILYRDIGLLLMMFMLGLSIGAIIIHRIFKIKKIINYKIVGYILIIAFAFINFLIYLLTKYNLLHELLTISIFLLLTGSFIAGIFAFASLYNTNNQIEQLKPLYLTDLIGGSLGSIAVSFIFIPVFGILSTALIIAVLTFSLLILII